MSSEGSWAPPTDREVGRLTASVWAFELKWDGYRALVGVVGGEVRIISRGVHDLTDRVPGLEALPGGLGVDAVLDAELVALGEDGRAPRLRRLDPVVVPDPLEADSGAEALGLA
ncbi:hypothetical protein [Dietzia sp. 179-F 9C3 NHS]|uniref:ATP-dependent DNA ligase n=1 Tax=Dietzia sp. 179-F 9C3 NHS TaxID=3374295 RepID=UPI003879387F